MDEFDVALSVRWGDLDPNGHVAHTVYGQYALEARLVCFARLGAPAPSSELSGVILSERVVYRSELRLRDEFVVRVRLAGLSEDGSRWRAHHAIEKADGTLAATVTSDLAWFSPVQRRIVVPPAEGLTLFERFPRTEGFEVIRRTTDPSGAG